MLASFVHVVRGVIMKNRRKKEIEKAGGERKTGIRHINIYREERERD